MMKTQFKVDSSSELSPSEQWFRHEAQSLRLLLPPLKLVQVQNALKTNMPDRVARVLPRLSELEDSTLWLSLILKTNFLIQLWRTPNEPVLVAMNVSGGKLTTEDQLKLIQSKEFSAARRDLGIAKHWLLTIQDQMFLPQRSELLDTLYNQLELENECGIIKI